MNREKIKELYELDRKKSEVHKKIGMSSSTLHNLINGSGDATITSIEKIAQYFGKHVGYFFDEEHPQTEQKTENGNNAVPEQETYKEIISRIFNMGSELNLANKKALEVKDQVISLMDEKRELEIKLENAEREIESIKKKGAGMQEKDT